MEKLNIVILLATSFSIVVSKSKSQLWSPPVPPLPLCASQIELANYACSRLPYDPHAPVPAPPAPPAPGPDDGDHERHGHKHRHRHHHSHRHHQTEVEANCCRWVKEVDSQCVCNMLVRLPDFLAKPMHYYTVDVGDSCNVTYTCGGRIIKV